MVWFPQLAFQRAQQPKVPNPQDEVKAVVPRRHYFYESSRVVYCPICISQVEILGMLLMSTRNLAEWEMFYFEEIGARTVGRGTHCSIRADGGNADLR
jgi:hypothetical protein